jgi:hypothetical protein
VQRKRTIRKCRIINVSPVLRRAASLRERF